jgi:hypothetical protein
MFIKSNISQHNQEAKMVFILKSIKIMLNILTQKCLLPVPCICTGEQFILKRLVNSLIFSKRKVLLHINDIKCTAVIPMCHETVSEMLKAAHNMTAIPPK